jgi:predicted nucleic acid-binding Zn ribbon protein
MRTPRHPTAVGTVLDAVLQRIDPEHRLPGYRLWTFWNEEVGEAIARRAQPTRLRNGILFVTVATHSWMQELRLMKESLRERLNTRLGAPLVEDIFFVAGDLEPPPSEPPPRTRAKKPR